MIARTILIFGAALAIAGCDAAPAPDAGGGMDSGCIDDGSRDPSSCFCASMPDFTCLADPAAAACPSGQLLVECSFGGGCPPHAGCTPVTYDAGLPRYTFCCPQ